MVHEQAASELGCDDGELGASPAVSTSSSASYYGTSPAKPAAEALPFECDQDHDEELNFMLLREARDAPSHSWLTSQPVLSAQHRRFLVAWMQRACEQLHFMLPTHALAVRLLDRFLCRTPVQRQDAWAVQLAAVACLSIAAKYEEVCVPANIASLQVDAPWQEPWQASQVMAMELALLQALEWRVGAATAPHFLDRLLHVANVGRDAAGQLQDPTIAHAARNTANSLIMTALLDERYLLVAASTMAASALLLSMSAWCSPTATAAAHAAFQQRLDPVALQACLHHMQVQCWQPVGTSPGTPLPPQLLFLASRRLAEARVEAAAAAVEPPPQQPRRSARLQHCPPPDTSVAATPASIAPLVGGPMILRLLSEDNLSVGSLASSRSACCVSPEESLPRQLTPSWGV